MNFGKFYIENWNWFNWLKENEFFIDREVEGSKEFKQIRNRIVININDRLAYFFVEKLYDAGIPYCCKRITLDGTVNIAVSGDNKELIKRYMEQAKNEDAEYEGKEKILIDFKTQEKNYKSRRLRFLVIKDTKNNGACSLYEINGDECKLIAVYDDFNETNKKIEEYLERE